MAYLQSVWLLNPIILVLFLQNIQCMPDEFKELAQVLHNTCQSKTGASEASIEEFRKGNFVEDNELKCYMYCIGDELATVDEDGNVDEEAMLALIPEPLKEPLTKMIKACGTKVGTDRCDTAFLTNKCYAQTEPKHYFLI